MEGTSENGGVNYRALEVLFNTSTKQSSDVPCDFSGSMLEVYGERVGDFLVEKTLSNKEVRNFLALSMELAFFKITAFLHNASF
jgi:Kinesin motor domain